MNHELFAISQASKTEDVLDALLDYGISTAPVLDDERRPLGVASIRDLAQPARPVTLRPVVSTTGGTAVVDAARTMAENGLHHLVVVDGEGRAIGMVSSLDLLRALVGLPPAHPATFPHRDAELGVAWTDAQLLDREHVADAPDEAGLLVLSVGGVNRVEGDVWVEATAALRSRVADLVELPQADAPALQRVLGMHDLRFRCAVVADAALREAVLATLQRRISSPLIAVGAPRR